MEKEQVTEQNETEISIEFGLLFDLLLSKEAITSVSTSYEKHNQEELQKDQT